MIQKIKKWHRGAKSKKIWKILICVSLVVAILFSALALVTRFAPSIYYTNNSNLKKAQALMGTTSGEISSYSSTLGSYGTYTYEFSGNAGGNYVIYVIEIYNSNTLATETVKYSIGLHAESYFNGVSITYSSSLNYTAGYYYTTSGLNLSEYYESRVTGTYLELADAAVSLADTVLSTYASSLGFNSASLLYEFASVSRTVSNMLAFSITMAIIFAVVAILLLIAYVYVCKINHGKPAIIVDVIVPSCKENTVEHINEQDDIE